MARPRLTISVPELERLLISGATTREIAVALRISERTVDRAIARARLEHGQAWPIGIKIVRERARTERLEGAAAKKAEALTRAEVAHRALLEAEGARREAELAAREKAISEREARHKKREVLAVDTTDPEAIRAEVVNELRGLVVAAEKDADRVAAARLLLEYAERVRPTAPAEDLESDEPDEIEGAAARALAELEAATEAADRHVPPTPPTLEVLEGGIGA